MTSDFDNTIRAKAMDAHWQTRFRDIAKTSDEDARSAIIRDCFRAARDNDLTFTVKDNHPHMSEIKAVFGDRYLQVEPAGYQYQAPVTTLGLRV